MEGLDIVTLIDHLGVAGFAILVMWWMYSDSSKRMDNKDLAFRELERDVREKVLEQLNKNTAAFEKVLDHFSQR